MAGMVEVIRDRIMSNPWEVSTYTRVKGRGHVKIEFADILVDHDGPKTYVVQEIAPWLAWALADEHNANLVSR